MGRSSLGGCRMSMGDHIYVPRLGGLYSHHGIDCGDGSVIHYAGDHPAASQVRRVDLRNFASSGTIHVRSYDQFYRAGSFEDRVVRESGRRLQKLLDELRGISLREADATPDAVVARAEERLGQGGFDFFLNNCEHFATWCKTGLSNSRQIEAIWRFALNPHRYFYLRWSSLMTEVLDGASHRPGAPPA